MSSHSRGAGAAPLSLPEILDQFLSSMAERGVVPSDPSVIAADGKLTRFHVEGERKNSKNGWYVLHADGLPAGEFGTWKDAGTSHSWRADIGREWTKAERDDSHKRMEAARTERAAALERERTKARAKVDALWKEARPRVTVTHDYLVAKGVRPFGIRQLRNQLLVPVRDTSGRLHGLQWIQPDGSKKFSTGTDKRGHYCAIGKPKVGEVLAIVEGWATGATVHELTGWAVAIAFDAGNLKPVAQALREKLPDVRLVICADNDHATTGNPGVSKAREAARAVDALIIAPEFSEGDSGTDFNDLVASEGKEAAKRALVSGLGASASTHTNAAADPKLSADSNDQKPPTAQAQPLPAHVEHEAPRSRYDLRPDGLYWIGVKVENGKAKELSPMFLCSPLKIEAVTRDIRGRNFGRLVSFTDSDAVPKTTVISARALGSSRSDELRGSLLSDGLPLIACETKAHGHLTRYLMREIPKARARMVTRTGWHGPAFVLPTQTFGNDGGERYYLSDDVGEASSYERAGTFERWRDHVSTPVGEHRRLLFTMSCAFAGPLLELAGAESGGFHLVSESTEGKTTALRLAGSVWGSPDSFWRQWRSTDNGLEAIAEEFNDTLLALDEIGQADPRIIGEVSYMLANGRGKQRARKEGGARAIKSWRVLLLSTGEVGSATLMNAAGQKTRGGHDVRLVEIPANAGRGFGLFDSVGKFESSRALALALVDGSRTDYGHAGPLFVQRLAGERTEIAKESRERIAEFVGTVAPPGADGQVMRVAARFGLVCFAGELATLWDLTGWDFEAVRPACVDAFQSWLRKRGTAGAKEPATMVAQVRAFIEAHGGARFQDISDERKSAGDYKTKDDPDHRPPFDSAEPDDIERRIINRAGYRKRARNGRTFYLVFPEIFRNEVCKDFDHVSVCAALAAAGVLSKPEGDRYTSKHSTPQSSKRLPMYALDGDALLDSEGA